MSGEKRFILLNWEILVLLVSCLTDEDRGCRHVYLHLHFDIHDAHELHFLDDFSLTSQASRIRYDCPTWATVSLSIS